MKKERIEELKEEIENLKEQIEENNKDIECIQSGGSYFIPDLFEEDFEEDFGSIVSNYVDSRCIYRSDCKEIVNDYLEENDEDIFEAIKEYKWEFGDIPENMEQLAAYILDTSCYRDCEEDFNTIKGLIDENTDLKEELEDLEDELIELELDDLDLEELEKE